MGGVGILCAIAHYRAALFYIVFKFVVNITEIMTYHTLSANKLQQECQFF